MTGYVSIFSPLINYGLGHIQGSLSPWRYMYLVAGAITVLWSFVILFFMPPDPIRARRFTDRERYIAVARMRENNSGVRNTHFKAAQLKELLLDRKFWMVFIMALTMLVANGPVSTFIPIIIHQLGFSGLNSLLLVMPAGFIIGTIEWTVPYIAYRFKGLRAYLVIITVCGTIIGSFILWLLPQNHTGARLFGGEQYYRKSHRTLC
jgi:MFS family permease